MARQVPSPFCNAYDRAGASKHVVAHDLRSANGRGTRQEEDCSIDTRLPRLGTRGREVFRAGVSLTY
jgi:hypothetical protein